MTGRILAEDIAEVRSRVRIDEVIGEHVTLRPAGGGSLMGLCPFHEERSPSFHVTPAKGLYHCFGCQAGGDAIAFLMQLVGLSFGEAVERLAAKAGISVRYEDGPPATQRSAGQRARLIAANAEAARFFAAALEHTDGSRALDLMAARGFDRAACQSFGVGYAPGNGRDLVAHLSRNAFGTETLLAAGLVAAGQHGPYSRFRDRLVWPIRDLTGDVIGFGARRLDDERGGPKYLNTPETVLYRKSAVLYGIDLARRTISTTQQVVIVEGYTDVMAAHLAGVTNAVATCGTAFGAEHIAVLRRLLFDDGSGNGEVIFTFDGDEAGRKAALRAFDSDQRFAASTYVAVEPDGLDPADLRLRHGDQAVRDLVASRVPLVEFALRAALAHVDVATAEGRMTGLRRAVPIIAGVRDDALRPEYARVTAGWLGLPEATVTRAMREHRGASIISSSPKSVRRLPAGLERDALRALLHSPWVAGPWLATVELDAFDEASYRDVYGAVQAVGAPLADEDEPAWLDRVIASCGDEGLRSLVRALAVERLPVRSRDDDDQASARYVESLLARLVDRDAGRRLDALTARLAQQGEASQSVRRALQHQYQAVADLRRQLQPTITSEAEQ